MKKLEKYLEMKKLLELEGVEIGETGYFDCWFSCKNGDSMKLFEELNAVSCMNPHCKYYREVYSPIDWLQMKNGGERRKAKEAAEIMLIEELEGYRKQDKGEPAPTGEEAKELRSKAKEFIKRLAQHLKEKGHNGFRIEEILACVEVEEKHLKYYLEILEEPGYIEKIGGNKHRGFMYELVRLPKEEG